MNGSILLDTNIVIALFGQDQKIRQRLSKAKEVFIPSIVLGELYYGAYKSTNVGANLDRISELAIHSTILFCDSVTAQHYGKIKNLLRTKGRPIPENDIWIAAIAEQYQLTIATRDEHFKEAEGILVDMW